MATAKKNIVIAENSYLLSKGLIQAMSQLSSIGNIRELDTKRSLSTQIEIEDPDIIIINPLLLGSILTMRTPWEALKIEKDIPIIALVYSLIDENYLQNFDAVINITDSFDTLTNKFQKVIDEMDMQENDNAEELSEREKEILIAVVKGFINKEIADHFNLSIHTVIAHRRNITRKLSIHSVSGLTVYAILNKLVDLNDIKII